MISTAPPFVLRPSKDERRVFHQNLFLLQETEKCFRAVGGEPPGRYPVKALIKSPGDSRFPDPRLYSKIKSAIQPNVES